MTATDRGLAIGKQLNDFLRNKKQIPHATPIIFNPRIQGWLNGLCDGLSEALNLNEADSHALRSAIYVNMFDGTSTGQRMGLDALSERQRILNVGPTLGYNAIYFEYSEKGVDDGKAFALNPNHTLLLYSLL